MKAVGQGEHRVRRLQLATDVRDQERRKEVAKRALREEAQGTVVEIQELRFEGLPVASAKWADFLFRLAAFVAADEKCVGRPSGGGEGPADAIDDFLHVPSLPLTSTMCGSYYLTARILEQKRALLNANGQKIPDVYVTLITVGVLGESTGCALADI